MAYSSHYGTDKYGYEYQNTISDFDEGIDVFSCEPPLEFDIKALGLKIVTRKHGDYSVNYEIRGGALYLTELSFESAPRFKPTAIFGAEPFKPYPTLRRYYYIFEHQPVDYSGIFRIGKDFDFRFWQGDEKAKPTPFCPEAYKQNGYIRFEKGKIVEIELHPRNE